jgi:competence protein ComEC
VAFLVAVVFLVLRRGLAVFESLALRCPVQLLAAALTLPALWFFVLFSGSQIPVARAGVSGAAALAAVLLWRRSGPVDLWALAAFVLVAADPFVLFSASFQLSFAAVGALMLVAGAPACRADQEGGAPWTTKWYGRARSLFVVSLAASAVTAPLVAFHFQQVSLVGPLANLFAVPFAGVVVLPAGWAALGAQALGAPGADALTAAALWSADRLVDVATWFAAPPWAAVSTARPSPLLTLGLVGLSAAFAQGAPAWTWTRFVACAGCAAAASAWVLATHWPTMLVTFLDVGQGLSVAAILPGGSSLLFDAGPRWRGYDAGERVVVPALRRLGVSRLDTLAISHRHPDHEGGAEAVTRHLGPRRLWRGSGPGALREGEEPLVPGGVRARVLNPGGVRAGSGRADADENDRSLGLMLTLGETGVVLTGDAGPGVAGALATAAVGAARRVALQAPHHGGSPPACALLAAALKPEVSVVSVGRNTYGHPQPGAIAALAAAGRVLRTDHDGAVHVQSDGMRLIVRTWRESAQRRTWAERLRWLVAGW